MNLLQEVLLFGCSFRIGKAAFSCKAASAHLFDFGDGYKCLRVNGAHNFIGGVEFSPSSMLISASLRQPVFQRQSE